VNDARCVHAIDRARSLDEEHHDVGRGHRSARDDLAEILAAEQLHHEEREARRLVDAGVEGLDDVLADDVRGDRRLAPEALRHLRVVDEPREHDLERAPPFGAAIEDLVHGAHRARVDAAYDLVLVVKHRSLGEGEGVLCRHGNIVHAPPFAFKPTGTAP
jgi:hypothetical protein